MRVLTVPRGDARAGQHRGARRASACPVVPRDYVSVSIDSDACIGCGLCEVVCPTDAFWARGERATVRKRTHYECTRDHACARNCPTGAIRLGNL